MIFYLDNSIKNPQPAVGLFKDAQTVIKQPMQDTREKPSLKWDGAIKTDESPVFSTVLDGHRRVLASHRASIEQVTAMALDAMEYAQNASDMRRIGDHCSLKLDLALDNAAAAARGVAEAL